MPGVPLSRVKAERPLTKGAGSPSRSRDPKVRSRREKRQLDYINAQVTARKNSGKRYPGWISSEQWFHIAGAALQRGGRMERPGVVSWNVAGRCEAPIPRTLTGVVTTLLGRVEARENATRTRYLDMEVPCRKCGPCLYRKSLHWRYRSMEEVAAARRTWMVTLTFAPAVRARILYAARASFDAREWVELSREKRSSILAKHAQPYVTLWLKRVREQSGAALRYILVTELHKDGTPHCHLLVHEAGETPVTYAVLTTQWAYGFSNAKLVEEGEEAARYVSKYLAKNPITRVRASVGYGQTNGAHTSWDIGRRP